jgi:thymidine phosphorylase
MDQPLGSAVGNALEVKEALEVLGRPAAELSDNVKRFRELCVYFVAQALRTTGLAGSVTEALERVESVLNSGRAMEKCKVWFNAQGATVDPATTSWLPVAPQKAELRSERSGFVLRVDARIVGEVALDLGAGRKEKADEIFPAVGIEVMIKVGQKIAENDVLFVIHGNSDSDVSAAIKNLRTAVSFSDSPVPPRRLILKVL